MQPGRTTGEEEQENNIQMTEIEEFLETIEKTKKGKSAGHDKIRIEKHETEM